MHRKLTRGTLARAYGVSVGVGVSDGVGVGVSEGLGVGSGVAEGDGVGVGPPAGEAGVSDGIGAGLSLGACPVRGRLPLAVVGSNGVGIGSGVCKGAPCGVGVGEGLTASLPSYPFLLAIASQSNLPSLAPFNPLTTKP